MSRHAADGSPPPLVAGPRQTTCRVQHPQRGAGLAVYENGPSFFLPDDGTEPVAMPIDYGGGSAGRHWLALRDPVHGRVEADQLGETTARHQRFWSPILGPGWFVEPGDYVGESRFEGDDGRVASFRWVEIAVGTPDYARRTRSLSRHVEPTAEETHWRTYTTKDGTVLGFRDGPPPDDDATPRPDLQPMLPGLDVTTKTPRRRTRAARKDA